MESKEECSRHPRFWIEEGNVVFRVQNTLYMVHRYFFKEYSPVFRDMFSLPPPAAEGAAVEGETEKNPIILYDEAEDFDRLLAVFYPKDFNFNDYSSSNWLSVLKLAHKYQVDGVRQLAIQRIRDCAIPVDMMLASRLYDAHYRLLIPALVIFSKRDAELTIAESRVLGGQDVLLVTRLRSAVRSAIQNFHRHSFEGSLYDQWITDLCLSQPALYTVDLTDDILTDAVSEIVWIIQNK